MKKEKSQVVLYFLILIFTVFLFKCGLQNASPIKIKYAKRAHRILLGDPINHQRLTPAYPEKSVVLDFQIKGISVDEFRSIDKENMYVMAGEHRCYPNITQSGTIGGKEVIRLCIVVPKDVQKFTLHLGSYPQTFKVKGKIYDELTDW